MIPKSWLIANIWPIHKKQTYNFDLNYTCPITLIEHARKILTKIITQRLSPILLKYNILSPNNNVALPQTSTLEPILTISHIIEDSHINNNKPYWILAQDMSKAYDTVHIPLLTKALKRIQIPQTTINLLEAIFTQRQNKVITDHRLIATYNVQDGIDQGETISPILW